MQITRTQILERIASIEREQADALRLADTLEGALQDCRFWLGRLDAEDAAGGESADRGRE